MPSGVQHIRTGAATTIPSIRSERVASVRGGLCSACGFENEAGRKFCGECGSPLVQTCAWLCSVYGLDPQVAIVGHRDYVATTQCPGDVLYARLPELRNRVATALGA